ncbi:MAG: type IV secretory system conjugative DNA transfer family protein [Oscillospiraceae bacterium]
MGYKVKADNVMRPDMYKYRIKGYIIGVLCILAIELLFIYNYLGYLARVGAEPGIVSFVVSIATLTSNFTLPITFYLIKEMLITWCNIWLFNIILFTILILDTYNKVSKFKGMEHGSASWANKEERKELQKTENSIPLADGLYLSSSNKNVKNLNEIVIGDTGAGKSFSKLIPDIMEMNSSFIISDVKGSLFKQTYKILEHRGYKIRILNFIDLKYTNTFNPFEYIKTDTDIDRLANSFIINSRREGASAGDSFWEDTAIMLMTSVISYLHSTPGENKTFFRIMDLVNSLELMNGKIISSCEYAKLISDLKEKDPFHAAVLNYELVIKSPPETLQSVIVSLQSKLRLWVNEDLRIMTNSDEIDIDKLAEEPTAIFVSIPAGDNTYKVVTSMFITTVLTRLAYLANNVYNGRLPRQVSLELDEFANIGILPGFDGAITTFRSQNIRALMIVQSLQQIEKNYDKANKTIISNCDTFNYLGTKDTDTREQVVKMLGKTTIDEKSLSKNIGGGKGGGSESDKGMGRELLTLDELGRISGKSIVFVGTYHPFFCDRYKTAEHPLFSMLGNDDIHSPHEKNNVYIQELYNPLYEKHKLDYESYKEAKKNKDDESKIDIFDNANSNGVSSDKLAARGEQKPESQEEQERLKNEFDRTFLKDLKEKNK